MPASPHSASRICALQNFALRNGAAAYKDGGFYSLIKDLSNRKTAWLLACKPIKSPVIK
jgi:hypothetical protein